MSFFVMFTACDEDEKPVNNNPTTGKFSIEFEHHFEGTAFNLGSTYTTDGAEDVNYNMVKYYISNIKMMNSAGPDFVDDDSYYIVDANDAGSLILEIDKVPFGEYHHISYTIGVDSAKNVSGAQAGALSPSNNMFWSWNSGYIFVKLEGTSTSSANGKFEYHLGGFAGPNRAQVEKGHHMHTEKLNIVSGANPRVHIMVNMKNVFDGMHPFLVADQNDIKMPSEMAQHIAHNFGGGFELDHVHN